LFTARGVLWALNRDRYKEFKMKKLNTARTLAFAAVTALAMSFGSAQAAGKVVSSASAAKLGGMSSVIGAEAYQTNRSAASTLVVDVAGIQSFSEFGEAGNVVRTFNIGAFATVTSVDWNLNLTAYDPSWLSELKVSFAGLTFTPGVGDNDPGTASYSGTIDLVDAGFAFQVGADGLLTLEFHEGFDDSGVDPDGIWNSGSLSFGVTAAVPEPSTYGLMALGLIGVVGVARRRKNA
jgi:hypothetical protein